MENTTRIHHRNSSTKATMATIAGIAIIGAVVMVAYSSQAQNLGTVSPGFLLEYTSEEQEAYRSFVMQYRKTYLSSEENDERFHVFVKNYRDIKNINSNKKNTFTVGVNQFADMTDGEFRENALGFKYSGEMQVSNSAKLENGDRKNKVYDAPDSADWRDKLVGVKSQGGCGSCWTFSTTAAIECAYAIKNGKRISLSEQELVDCSHNDGNNGCNGGEMWGAFNYVIENGIHLSSLYPYQAKDNECTANSDTHGDIALKLDSYVNITFQDNDELKEAVGKTVVSVAVMAGRPVFRFYEGGILDSEACNENLALDHAVAAVGYGTENNVDYWIIRNSWGPSWGEAGHIRLKRDTGVSPGMCGVASFTNYPVLPE